MSNRHSAPETKGVTDNGPGVGWPEVDIVRRG
jgi:hypothetical protein